MKSKDAIYKANKIKKLALRIREELASGHDAVMCQCAICSSTYFVQRTMVFLESKLKDPEFLRSLNAQLQAQASQEQAVGVPQVQAVEGERGQEQAAGQGDAAPQGDAV